MSAWDQRVDDLRAINKPEIAVSRSGYLAVPVYLTGYEMRIFEKRLKIVQSAFHSSDPALLTPTNQKNTTQNKLVIRPSEIWIRNPKKVNRFR